jgi:hypothetical protein
MLLCCFGDVHGNTPALRAVLADAARFRPELYCCTGDVVPGLGSPAAAVDTVLALGCPWVTGNAEQWVLGTPEFAPDPASRRAQMVAWSREVLGPDRLRRLSGLPRGIVLRLGAAGSIWLAHGTPPDVIQPGIRPTGLPEWTEVADDAQVAQALGPEPPGLLLCGHTHVPTLRQIGPTLFVNPGSVGEGIHPDAPARFQEGNAVARYALAHREGDGPWEVDLRAVPYAVEETVAELTGLPWMDAQEMARRRAHLGLA